MEIRDFPYCCTAQLMVGFGESEVAEGGDFKMSLEDMKSRISMQMNYWVEEDCAMVVATTNSEQKTANKALKELGFDCSEWMYKSQHPETKVRLWWLNVAKKNGNLDRFKENYKLESSLKGRYYERV